jgi:hypothetical protein
MVKRPTEEEMVLAKEKARIEHDALVREFYQRSGDFLIKKYEGVPQLYKKLFVRQTIGKSSMPAAIKLKCLDCTNYQKEEITKCTVLTCSLHRIRPYQNKNKIEA